MANDNWLSDEQQEKVQELLNITSQAERDARRAESDRLGSAEGAPKWDGVSWRYKEVVEFLDEVCEQEGRARIDLPEDTKQLAVSAWIGCCYCRLQITRNPDLGIYRYDVGKQIGREIKDLEKEIDSYQVRHQASLWNVLQGTYDQWGEARRNYGMKYEADELEYYMLRARMRRERWRVFSGYSLLSRVVSVVGKQTTGLRISIPTVIKRTTRCVEDFSDFVHAWLDWALYWAVKGLFWPFLLFMIFPIVFFAFLYDRTNSIRFENGTSVPPGLLGFWYSLYFSVFVFTGSEPGALTTCGNPTITGLMALEAMFAYVFMVVVVGYLVNRLSSR